MLAERSSPPWRLAAIVAGGLGLFGLFDLAVATEEPQVPIAYCHELPISRELPRSHESCPDAMRSAMHLSADATLVCSAVEAGYFVTAYYHTTEWWERYGVISRDAHVVVPLVDRPSNQQWEDGDALTHTIVGDTAIRMHQTANGSFRLEAMPVRDGDIGFARGPLVDGQAPLLCTAHVDGLGVATDDEATRCVAGITHTVRFSHGHFVGID